MIVGNVTNWLFLWSHFCLNSTSILKIRKLMKEKIMRLELWW